MAKKIPYCKIRIQTERKSRRKGKTLKDQQVARTVLARYQLAYATICLYWKLCSNTPLKNDDYDAAVSKYVEHLYAEGEGYCNATDTLASVQYYVPAIIGCLKHSWKMCKIWRAVEPPKRVRPFTPLIVLGLAGAALSLGAYDLCAILLVGFDTFMRTGELFSLLCGLVSLYEAEAVIRLIDTKTSKRKCVDECAVVDSALAVKALRKAMKGKPKSTTVRSLSIPKIRAMLKELLNLFGLDVGAYNFYSLRRGGATSYFFKTGSMEKTLAKGRWESVATARIYIQDAVAQAGELALSKDQVKALQLSSQALKRL